jgi:hypothetical protein
MPLWKPAQRPFLEKTIDLGGSVADAFRNDGDPP